MGRGVLVELTTIINPLMGAISDQRLYCSCIRWNRIIPGAVFGGFFLGMTETIVCLWDQFLRMQLLLQFSS